MAGITEAVPERVRKISVVETLDHARRALSTHKQWLRRRLSMEEEFGLFQDEADDRPTEEGGGEDDDMEREWTVADVEDEEEEEKEETISPPAPRAPPPTVRRRTSSMVWPSPGLGSLVEEEETSAGRRTDWATGTGIREREDGNLGSDDSMKRSPQSKRPKMRLAKVSPAISSSPDDTANKTTPTHIFTSSSSIQPSPPAPDLAPLPPLPTTIPAWGSLSSLDHYMESLEEPRQPAPAAAAPRRTRESFPAPEFATTSAVSLNFSSSSSDDESSESDCERDSNLLAHSSHLAMAGLKGESVATSLQQRGGIDLAALQSESKATILPVGPAPKEQRSSYEIHRLSKLEQVGMGLRVIEVEDRDPTDQLEGSDHQMKIVLGERVLASTSSISTSEAVVEDVLPYQRSEGAILDHSSQTGQPLGSSLMTQSHCTTQVDTDNLGLGPQPDELDTTAQEEEEKTKDVGDGGEISFHPRVTSTPANTLEAESPGKRRRQMIEDLQLPPLKENRVSGARSILSRLPRLKSTTPTSPTKTAISTVLKLSSKRSQELPSYTTHHHRGVVGQALVTPCPQYGVKQPEAAQDSIRIPQRKRLFSAPTFTPLVSSPTFGSPLRHKKTSVQPLPRKRYSSSNSPLLTNRSFDGSSSSRTPPVSPVVKTPRPSSAKEKRSHSGLRETLSVPPNPTTPAEGDGARDGAALGRRASSGLDSPLLRARSSSDRGLEEGAGGSATSVTSLYQMHSGPGQVHLAAKLGNLRQLQKMLLKGENVDVRDHEGRTPLMYCVHLKGVHLSCASLLIQGGAGLDKQASDGSTVVHLAAAVGAVSLVEFALVNEADPDIRDFEGRLPLHWATMTQRSSKCAAVLLEHSKLDVNAVDDAGMTALMWAAYNNNPLVTAFLLGQGADCEEKDMDGMTAMHWAVHQEGTKCLELLLKADHTYFKDHKGRTVLHLSAEVGCMAACELVLSLRADAVYDLDRMGRTPLHYAAACSRVDVCALLLDRGSDASQRDLNGKTAIEYARRKKFDYVVALLTCHGTAVADFARASRSTSISSLLNQTTSFSELSEEDAPANQDLITESLLPLPSSCEDIRRSSESVVSSTASASLYNGAFLGRFVQDKSDPLRHYFFWIGKQSSETGLLYWSKKRDRHRPQMAVVYEVHAGPSGVLRQNPAYSADELHKHVFWIRSDSGVFDLLAYNEAALEEWVRGLGGIARGAPLPPPETDGSEEADKRSLFHYKKKKRRTAVSVAPALVVENEASTEPPYPLSGRHSTTIGLISDSEIEITSPPSHTPTPTEMTNEPPHQLPKLQEPPQSDIV